MAQMIANAIGQAWTNFLYGVEVYLPRIVATVSIVLVGWLIATVLRVITTWGLRSLRFDALSERSGLARLLKVADLPTASVLAGSLIFWLVLLAFLLSGVDALGLPPLEGLV